MHQSPDAPYGILIWEVYAIAVGLAKTEGTVMNTSTIATALALTFTAGAGLAQETFEVNNIYRMNQETYQLADKIFYTQDNDGYFEVLQGPIEEGPVRCIGSGFGNQDGTGSIEGICIYGEGDDTFTMEWQAGEQGAANTWVIETGSGIYAGITGQGIATTAVEIMYKAMPLRQSHVIGTITLPPN